MCIAEIKVFKNRKPLRKLGEVFFTNILKIIIFIRNDKDLGFLNNWNPIKNLSKFNNLYFLKKELA